MVMNDKEHKQESVAAINAALKKYRGGSYIEPPSKRIYSDQYGKLHRLQIDQGVIALVHACNLSGGSVGNDIDLYKLARNYLWHPKARAEINRIVERCERGDFGKVAA